MSNTVLSIETRQMVVGETIIYTADFTEILAGRTLASVSSIDQKTQAGVTSTNLTVGVGTVNADEIEVEEGAVDPIAIGKGIQFSVAAGTGDEGNYVLWVYGVVALTSEVVCLGCQIEVASFDASNG